MKKLLSILFVSLALILCLTACDSAAHDNGYASEVPLPDDEMSGANGSTEGKVDITDSEIPEEYDRKIIRTVSLDCETKSFDQATRFLTDTLSKHGGHVEASKVTGTGYSSEQTHGSERFATYTFRVPAEHLDAFLAELTSKDGIRIISQASNSDEVTGTYYDIATRIATLESERDSLLTMLESFTDYNDMSAMLQVQERLYDVIEEIEALQTRLNLYDDKVALSTVNLTLREVVTYTPAATPSFGERISEAFTEGWSAFAMGCQDFAVWFVASLPALLFLVIFLVVLPLVIIFSIRRKNRKKKTAVSDQHNNQ